MPDIGEFTKKTYISDIWDKMSKSGMTRDEFNAQLLEANRKDLIALTRRDITWSGAASREEQAKIKSLISRSEIKTYSGDVVHYVSRSPRRRN